MKYLSLYILNGTKPSEALNRVLTIFFQDVDYLKTVEEFVSVGMRKLAKVFDKHLAARRECILTAFSITPSQALLQEVNTIMHEMRDLLNDVFIHAGIKL